MLSMFYYGGQVRILCSVISTMWTLSKKDGGFGGEGLYSDEAAFWQVKTERDDDSIAVVMDFSMGLCDGDVERKTVLPPRIYC